MGRAQSSNSVKRRTSCPHTHTHTHTQGSNVRLVCERHGRCGPSTHQPVACLRSPALLCAYLVLRKRLRVEVRHGAPQAQHDVHDLRHSRGWARPWAGGSNTCLSRKHTQARSRVAWAPRRAPARARRLCSRAHLRPRKHRWRTAMLLDEPAEQLARHAQLTRAEGGGEGAMPRQVEHACDVVCHSLRGRRRPWRHQRQPAHRRHAVARETAAPRMATRS